MVVRVVRLAGLLDILLNRGIGFLRGRDVSRLQRGPQGAECLGQSAVALQGARNVLFQGAEIRLGLGEVPRLKILSQLLKLILNLLRLSLPVLHALTQRA